MSRFIHALLLSLAAFASADVHAIFPDSGWYWNPAESGRGVAIEVQDNKIFLAIYTYDSGGAPIYYYSAGTMADDHTYAGDLFRTTNGQCIGCSYRAPTSTPVGTVTVNFTAPELATVIAMGTVLTLQRFDFSDTNLFNPQALFGEWATTEGEPSIAQYFGERITLNALGAGGTSATGSRTGASANFAVGSCSNRNTCSIGLRSSSAYDVYYLFSMAGFNRAEGLVQVVPAGASPVAGAGLSFVMQRIRTGAKVRTGVGPGMTKSTARDDRGDATVALKAAAAAQARPDAAQVSAFSTPEAAALLQRVAASLAGAAADRH
jgi:hypothetical protein